MNVIGKSKPLNVVIAGGSLGGLFCGIALKQIGHNTTILERNPTPLLHNQGAGIVAGGDLLAFFEKYDRCQRPIAVRSRARMYLNKEGRVIHRDDRPQHMTSWDLVYYVLRANYDEVKSDYCDVPASQPDDGTTQHLHGHKVTGFKDLGDGVEVQFTTKDGTTSNMRADLLIGADGPSSTVRKILEPSVQRTLAGYVALRGTVPEDLASDAARGVFQERFTFFHDEGIQILAYLIPGINGALEPEKRLVNWVWYINFPEHSLEFEELMTDKEGARHSITLPPGKMQEKVWAQLKDRAKEQLPPQFAELVQKTEKPFVQVITDVICQKNEFCDGRVILVGDALAGFRPHTAASTSQAAFDAMTLADMLEGEISREQWREETMHYARKIQQSGVQMGNRSQFGHHPLAEYAKDRGSVDDRARGAPS
ncbi:hypothetical protein W97_09087 [Coniosporium apollinis CBS 100218]|uniref:2,6-dihydroxypyridine 3-monooxygenase substrate binding domain-containing protein n=1 Tax=Coniosporium apollinis (strain CBS 100218) TaxID=1168221 RepID=R7Z732_CONA1|nr:uncharacterized protein W97_09087 [Coniosporium apollinis CBS 100218]EON69824.1 hypothetical protein W97_09087 [Coniosporium apollinis CBS 100218]